MHELPVTQQILDIALKTARENQASEILAINLVIGDLTSFIDDSIQFYFDFLSKNTIAEKARLKIKRIPVELCCRNCRTIFTPQTQLWECPNCRGLDMEILKGQEFYLDSIDI
jgi:hydrogenase nickel incorporation protein HypA/HybF